MHGLAWCLGQSSQGTLVGEPLVTQVSLRQVKKKKNIRNEFPLAWVNVTILDFKNCLRQGQLQLAVKYKVFETTD